MYSLFRRHLKSFLVDALALFLSFWGAFFLWKLADLPTANQGIISLLIFNQFALIALLVQSTVFLWEGVYSIKGSYLEYASASRIQRGLLLTPLLLFLVSLIAGFGQINKFLLLTGVVLNLIMNPVLRSLLGIHDLPTFDKARIQRRKLIILGNGVAGECLLRRVIDTHSNRYDLVGFLERTPERVGTHILTNSKEIQGKAEVLGTYDDFDELLESKSPDEIWINDLSIQPDRLEGLIQSCRKKDVEVSLVPSLGQYPPQSLEVEMLDFVPILRPRRISKRPLYEAVKRVFDLVASSLVLIVLSPVVVPILVGVRIGSDGPIIFRQKRVGERGKLFTMYKFRSMYSSASPYNLSPNSQDDERITPIGRFLRRTSLDELPQLLNVIKGNMSLVGPRPEMPFIVEQYNDLQRIRLAVKPGITGLWQLSLDRTLPIHLNLDYDLYYIHNRSLLLDLTILWRTLFLAMRGI
ncbi:MAG: sugar transferase [bacterium]